VEIVRTREEKKKKKERRNELYVFKYDDDEELNSYDNFQRKKNARIDFRCVNEKDI